MNHIEYLAIFGLSPIFLIASVEFLKRRFDLPPEWTRRFIHIAVGTIAIFAYIFKNDLFFFLGSIFFIVTILIVRRKNLLTSVDEVERHSYGDILLLVSFPLIALISTKNPYIFITSIAIVTYADSMSGITSSLLKKAHNTTIGLVTFFLVAYIIICSTTSINWYSAVMLSFVLAFIENISDYGSDNITVPIASALLISLFY